MGSGAAGRPVDHSAEQILAVLGNQRLTTQEVAAQLGCHSETATRRLRQLEQEGLLTSTRGGQVLLWTRDRSPQAVLVTLHSNRLPDFRTGIRSDIDIEREGIPTSLIPDELRDKDEETVRAWAFTRDAVLDNLAVLEQLYPGDRLLFVWEDTIVAECTLDQRIDNPQVSDYLWPETVGNDDTEYPVTLLVSDYRPRSISLARLLGPDGYATESDHQSLLASLPDDRRAYLVDEYGSLGNALAEIHTDPPAVLPGERAAETELPPDPTEGGEHPAITWAGAGIGKTERMVQATLQHRLTERLPSMYEHKCAICGAHRLAPAGAPEVEVAYFQPLSQGGAPTPQNAVVLCQLHHWALDTGWLAISDEFEVLIRDLPDHPGFAELNEFAGTSLSLPADDAYHPDPTYLRAHRDQHQEATWRDSPIQEPN